MNYKELAIIIPIHNEANAILKNFNIIYNTLLNDNIKPSFVLIDDGSTDKTYEQLQNIEKNYENVKIIRFSKNFGKELAIFAGLDSIISNYYIIMDSDLQHPPKYISKMIEIAQNTNSNIVMGIKSDRGNENIIYKFLANFFYKFLNMISDFNFSNSSDFMLLDRESVIEVLKFREKSIFFRGIIQCIGFKKEYFYFDVENRIYGNSSFSINKLINLAFSAISFNSKKLLFFLPLLSFIFFILSIIFIFISYINKNNFLLLIYFSILGNFILISFSIIAIYISKIYDEIRNKPIYIKYKEKNE